MKLGLNWALFLLTAASYVIYPVWNLPLPWYWQFLTLNLFVLLSAAALYSPLKEVSLDLSIPELKEIWPAVLLAAAAAARFWLLPLPTGGDDQSHAGPAAWFIGRVFSGLGLDVRLMPLFTLAGLAAAGGVIYALRGRLKPPRPAAAAAALAVAGNLFFLADMAFGAADAVGRYDTVLRYPPLSKFLYSAAYLLTGLHEFGPRAVQFSFILLTAVCVIRLLRFMKADISPSFTYLLVAFFPTFFNLSISTELEAGTVFFFAAAIYFFIKAVAGDSRADFLKCAFWTASGFFYKQLPLGLMAAYVPALLALAWFRREKRDICVYGLKTIAIPALVGLPFIVLGVAYDIRGTGLIYSRFTSVYFMTLYLRTLYWTCGAAVTFMLAASAAGALVLRRGYTTWLMLYFSAAYYLLISGTEAVGFIRHAQPFYIAPVFFLALMAAGIRSALPRFAVPLAALALAPLMYQSVLAAAPYQRKTLSNMHLDSYPYWDAAGYLARDDRRGLKIYAPMEVEPSHFYLAQRGLAGRIVWDRDIPQPFTPASAAGHFRSAGLDRILLPVTPSPALKEDFPAAAAALKASGEFETEAEFSYHGSVLELLRPVKK